MGKPTCTACEWCYWGGDGNTHCVRPLNMEEDNWRLTQDERSSEGGCGPQAVHFRLVARERKGGFPYGKE